MTRVCFTARASLSFVEHLRVSNPVHHFFLVLGDHMYLFFFYCNDKPSHFVCKPHATNESRVLLHIALIAFDAEFTIFLLKASAESSFWRHPKRLWLLDAAAVWSLADRDMDICVMATDVESVCWRCIKGYRARACAFAYVWCARSRCGGTLGEEVWWARAVRRKKRSIMCARSFDYCNIFFGKWSSWVGQWVQIGNGAGAEKRKRRSIFDLLIIEKRMCRSIYVN